jgi:hypothetical protein
MPVEDEPRPPQRPGWGCLVAAIVAAIGLLVLGIYATDVLRTALEDVKIR